jgi:hypothetical protein
MSSAELTSTQAPQEPAAGLQAPRSGSRHIVADGHPVGLGTLADPEAVGRQASPRPRAHRRRGLAAFHIAGRWLRRALADSARAWALAAGVPPDLYH